MEVGIGVIWEIIVDSQVDTFNINTTPKNISGNTDTLVELLEFLVALDTSAMLSYVLHAISSDILPFLLTNTRVDCD